MPVSRNGRNGSVLPDQYTEKQIESVLTKCGVTIDGETFNDYTCFCPFHGNRHTPSMSVSKTNGKFICFNASCGTTGSIQDLVKAMLKTNEFQTARIISNAKTDETENFLDVLKRALEPVEFQEWQYAHTLDGMQEKLFSSPKAYKYMVEERGFDESILREYHIGYNYKRDLICVPMYSAKGIPLGVIGRSPSVTDKQFKNSPGLPTSKSLWNIHKAKRTGDTVIVCEASFDAMRIAQAGYPNVVACLGGNFSDYHEQQLGMYFSNIVIMTDFDDKEKHRYASCRKCMVKGLDKCIGHNPGRALGQKIADKMKGKSIKWAATDYGLVYPEGCKDAGDMTLDQISTAVKNAVSNMEYQSWGIAS